jgi:hypothetical protein
MFVIGSGPAGRCAAVQPAKAALFSPNEIEVTDDSGECRVAFTSSTRSVLNLKGAIDYFIENTLAEAYKIALLDAWNRMTT